MNRRNSIFQAILVYFLTIYLTGCAAISAPLPGQIEALHSGETLRGVILAENFAPGTVMFFKNHLITYAWALGDGWGFAVRSVDPQKPATLEAWLTEIGGCGQFICWEDMSALAKTLATSGWEIITSSSVLSVVKGVITTAGNSEGLYVIIPAMVPTSDPRYTQ